MILRARWVVGRDLRLTRDGSIRVAGRAGEVDLGDRILLPGLVNAHCHLDYTSMRGDFPKVGGFARWIEAIGRAKRRWGVRDYRRSIILGMRESLAYGSTAMVNWICVPEALPPRGAPPMRVWWLWEQIAYRPGSVPDRAGWTGWREKVRRATRPWCAGVAPHAPYTCTGEVLRAAVAWSARHRVPWSVHVAESTEEMQMFREGRGGLFDFMQRVGRGMGDCGGRTPLSAVWPAVRASRVPVLLVHANCLRPDDIRRMASSRKRGVPLSVVHCPRSTRRLGHPPFPYGRLRAAGVPVVLGTDSLASNDDLSMFGEMRALAENHPGLHPRRILAMASVDAARAIGAGRAWERWRDWIAIPCRASREAGVWEAILGHRGPVAWAMVDGRTVSA